MTDRPRRRRRVGNNETSGVGPVPTWEDVAREHGAFIFTVAYRLTGNRHDAEDLVQDVLVRVQRGLRTYQPGSMQGWLSRITTNAFLDEVRRKKRRPTDFLPEDAERVLPASAGADEALSHSALPDDVQASIMMLAEDYRAAVVLSDVVGLTYQEISEALDVPIGTVRSRIHRGRSQLRGLLGPLMEGDVT
jgi:RNA polymerase sigma factor (sigma-70 family)